MYYVPPSGQTTFYFSVVATVFGQITTNTWGMPGPWDSNHSSTYPEEPKKEVRWNIDASSTFVSGTGDFFFILSHIACAWLTHFKLTIFFSSPPCFLPAGIFHFCNEAIQDPDISTVQHQQPYCMKKEWLVVINAPGTGVFCPCSICKLSYSPPYTLCHILSACWM